MSEAVLKLTEREAELFRETAQQLLDFFGDDVWQNGNGGTFYGARMARRLQRWAKRMKVPSQQRAFPFPAVYRPDGQRGRRVRCTVVGESASGQRYHIKLGEPVGAYYRVGYPMTVTKGRVQAVDASEP